MDFTEQLNKEKEFYYKDFSVLKPLFKKIRNALSFDEALSLSDLDLSDIINIDFANSFVYITLFQPNSDPIRWGTCRSTLEESLNRNIQKLKQNKNFKNFEVQDEFKCRIMLEYQTEKTPVDLNKVTDKEFAPNRFEPGITGIMLVLDGQKYVFMPSDAWTKSMLYFKRSLNVLMRKTYLKNLSDKISERFKLLQKTQYQSYFIKSRTFITYQDKVLPLYRGNILNKYSKEEIKDIALNGANWILRYQKDNGQFLYYYDAKNDNYVDHEHPTRSEDNLYYNDLRHCGGCITLLRAYQLTHDKNYLIACQKGLDYIKSISVIYKKQGQELSYVFLNKKAKLGATGLILTAMMKYRNETNDKSNDEDIKRYTRHLISRIYKTGEMLGYYIHPDYHSGKPLETMTEDERRNMFSFYYPGEALLGLALFVKYFNDDLELTDEVKQKCKLALDWIVEKRPKIYPDMFTTLPSDAWLMQAIEEWVDIEGFNKDNYINFVFNDAKAMQEHCYHKTDSPYLDYDGGFYYDYGDVYYPDGARSEGLISAYYLAKKLNKQELADSIIDTCRHAAKAQISLSNNDKNGYAHKNPAKAYGAIRFKPTRQWVRVDTVQHVACFFFRLYQAENDII